MRLYFSVFILLFLSCAIKKPKNSYSGRFYKVKKNDNWKEISQKHRIPVEELKEINGLERQNPPPVGRLLYIPEPDPIHRLIAQKQKNPESKPLGFKEIKKTRFDFPLDQGKVLYFFSKDKRKPYEGLGIKAKEGQKVNTIGPGRVLYAGNDGTRFGLVIILEHQDDFISVYAHLKSALVKEGQMVKKREIIGTVGLSGGLKEPLLHLQLRKNQKCIDPQPYLL